MIKLISFKESLPEMRFMFQDHWEEVASNKEKRNLNINEDFFISLEENNILLSLGAFIDQKLVGYSINIFTMDTHDSTKTICVNDALYVDSKYRKGSLGIKLINQTEVYAKKRDCYGVIWHAKPNSSLDILLEKLDYKIKDFLYLKEI